jgi:hypothetical protein
LQTRQLGEAKDEAERQRAAFARQNFEGTFFQLLRQFQEVAHSVRIATPTGAKDWQGRSAFKEMVRQLGVPFLSLRNFPEPAEDLKRTPEYYGEVYKMHESELGPYFRNLYHAFKFIDKSDRNEPERIAYANIVRAQLSINEAVLLFYNGIWGEGRNFRELIERYGILKHVPRNRLMLPQHMDNRIWYRVSAFQNEVDRKKKSPVPSDTNARLESASGSP